MPPLACLRKIAKKAAFCDNRQGREPESHGAAIQLDLELRVGSVGKVRIQQGTLASARIVAQVLARHGASTCAIEFLDQGDYRKELLGDFVPHKR